MMVIAQIKHRIVDGALEDVGHYGESYRFYK